jgi:hypothetical protein
MQHLYYMMECVSSITAAHAGGQADHAEDVVHAAATALLVERTHSDVQWRRSAVRPTLMVRPTYIPVHILVPTRTYPLYARTLASTSSAPY